MLNLIGDSLVIRDGPIEGGQDRSVFNRVVNW